MNIKVNTLTVLVLLIFSACNPNQPDNRDNIKTEVQQITPKTEFTLDELLRMLSYDQDEFDTYVLEKGYYFDKSDISEDGIEYAYFNVEEEGSMQNSRLVGFTDYMRENHGALASCRYSTYEEDEYIKIKKGLKQKGFTFSGSRRFDESTVLLIYEKGKVDVILSTNNLYSDTGELLTRYQIELILFRNPDKPK